MHLGGHCPGCGGGEGNQPCKIAKCSLEHERIEYCNQCESFPCEKYPREDEFDSFITYRNRYRDFQYFLNDLMEDIKVGKVKSIYDEIYEDEEVAQVKCKEKGILP